tara:strand:- start:17736 stop:18986 length:1251 start_codon:yes stop_codon:yes gene_type:complete
MRILFLSDIVDPGVGSSVRQTFQLARELRKRGHDTAVVGTVRDAADATPTEVDDCQVYRLHSEYPRRFRAWTSMHNKQIDAPFEQVLQEWRPDVVHGQLVHEHLGYHTLTQSKRAGARVLLTAHDVMTFCYQKLTCFHGGEESGGTDFDVVARASKCIPCQRFRFRPGRNAHIRKVLGRDVDRFHAVSDALADILRANDLTVHRTVHNALDWADTLPSDADVAAFRRRFGLEGKQVLAIGGRLHSQKGVGKLLEMLRLLRPQFPDVRLIVMGRREIYDSEFAPQAKDLGVADLVVPTDWLNGDELAQAYAAADVFVTPSLCFDTFGLVNLEAMEHAKPVVATSFGGSCEVVEHGVTGFIANPFDLETFAGAIAKLLGDEACRLEMGRQGRLRLESRFGIARLADECLDEYGSPALA